MFMGVSASTGRRSHCEAPSKGQHARRELRPTGASPIGAECHGQGEDLQAHRAPCSKLVA